MKKFLALILAVIMVLSMSVFAFAAPTEQILDKTTSAGDVVIKTATTDGDGDDAKKYDITIPADTVIPWGTEATDLVYKVEAHLGHGEAVKVKVAGNSKMSYVADATTTYELPYTLTGATAYTADSPVVYPEAQNTITVGVTADDWNAAVVGEYSDTLTFTAEVVTA